MLSARVQTIIISDPGATAYIIINILVATAICVLLRVRVIYVYVHHSMWVTFRVFVCTRMYATTDNGRLRTGVELEERTEREALFAYGTTLYNVERLFRYL